MNTIDNHSFVEATKVDISSEIDRTSDESKILQEQLKTVPLSLNPQISLRQCYEGFGRR